MRRAIPTILLLFACSSAPQREDQILRMIDLVNVGMAEPQVVEVLGLPAAIESAPFVPTTLPSNSASCNSATATSWALAKRRSRYLWSVRKRDHAIIHQLEVYYDAASQVAYVYHVTTVHVPEAITVF